MPDTSSSVSHTPLTRDQMRRAVERRGGVIPRTPLGWIRFYNAETVRLYGDRLAEVGRSVPEDFLELRYIRPGNTEAPQGTPESYRWAIEEGRGDLLSQGYTSRLVISSTDLIDRFIERMPDPGRPEYFEAARQKIAATPDRYRLAWDFFCLFEQAWFLFGMENIMCDMMLHPDRTRRLLRALVDYHKKVIDRYADLGADGYFTSDDLGGQTALLFSERHFRDLFLPNYEELVDYCHRRGMTFWFHTDGAIGPIMDDLIAIGMDVMHPLQEPPLDIPAIARTYGDRLTLHVGIDIQYLLPGGTPEEVAAGTRRLIDLCDRPEGGCLLAASNGIMPDTPLANIATFFRTAADYGAERRAVWR